VLADHTKIGEETMCQTVPAARVHTLITDSRAKPAELEAIPGGRRRGAGGGSGRHDQAKAANG